MHFFKPENVKNSLEDALSAFLGAGEKRRLTIFNTTKSVLRLGQGDDEDLFAWLMKVSVTKVKLPLIDHKLALVPNGACSC